MRTKFQSQRLRFVLVVLLTLIVAWGCVGYVEQPDATLSPSTQSSSGSGGSGSATPLNCPIGQLECAGSCVDTSSNGLHCGACGNACPAGTFCEGSACKALCATGQLECGGACETIVSDLGNCGACGVACEAGQFCASGACGAECPFQPCDGASGLECADIQTNPEHCGGCGAACSPGESCVDGRCTLVCPTGLAQCGTACVQTQSDSMNCGTCGKVCDPGVACISGACGCAPGQALCNGACVDILSDAANCGGCGMACSSAELCEAGACKPTTEGCSPGLTPCESSCVDAQTSNSHCGTCNNACTAGRSCVAGMCECSGTDLFCEGACVDVIENESHCGDCNVVCTAGRSCIAGACECEGEQEFCLDSCIDLQVNNEHCGSCGTACSGGQTCVQGVCTCPDGLEFCGGNCVDVNSTDAHCSGCDKPCALGKACVTGACTGGGGTGEDGCSGLAKGLTVSQVAVYQSVKIPVMNDGTAVAPASRITDVIAGRETMVRVFVTLEAGFVAREISARLVVTNDGIPSSYYQKKTINKTSVETDQSTTFQLYVPKDQIKVGATFYVEMVECGTTGTGAAVSPRYPAGDAEADLGARALGALKLKIVPIRANNMVPDTSAAALDVYRQYLLAMYPVETVEISVGPELAEGYPNFDWEGALDDVRARRSSESPPSDVYYYGLLKPTSTFDQFCGGSCTAGIGYVSNQASYRAAVGIGWADNASSQTMAHELGHNHGRNHAPCGNVAGADQNYPHANGGTGVWGYDFRSKLLLNPASNTDIMGYCGSKWISDYTYDALVTRVASVNGVQDVYVAPESLSTWRVLLLSSKGPRWGNPVTIPAPASGDPEPAEVLDQYGDVIDVIDVYRTEIADTGAASIQVPEPQSGWHSVRVAGWPPLAFAAPSSP